MPDIQHPPLLISSLLTAHGRLQHSYDQLLPLQKASSDLALQERVHAHALAAATQTLKVASEERKNQLQSLLTRCVQDIIDPDLQIVLHDEPPKASASSKNQLFYHVLKGDSLTHLHANGGALHNVVTTALRIVATFYSSQRRILVLDEPDCWIAPENISNYFKTLTRLGTGGNFQTLIISHHNVENFDIESSTIHTLARQTLPNTPHTFTQHPTIAASLQSAYAHLLDFGTPPPDCPFNLDNDQQFYNVKCTSQKPHASWPLPSTPGIRALELVNFREHFHTKIPLSPGVNILQGPNNVGKSAALRAAFQCLFDSNLISPSDVRTNTNAALIRLYLENNVTIELSRQTGRAKTCMWHISDHASPNPLLNRSKAKDPNARVATLEEVLHLLNIDPDIQVQDQFDGATFNFKSRSETAPHSTLHQRGPLFEKLLNFRKHVESLLKSIKISQTQTLKEWSASARTLQPLSHLFNPPLPPLDNPSTPLPLSASILQNLAQTLQDIYQLHSQQESHISQLSQTLESLQLAHLKHLQLQQLSTPLTPLEANIRLLTEQAHTQSLEISQLTSQIATLHTFAPIRHISHSIPQLGTLGHQLTPLLSSSTQQAALLQSQETLLLNLNTTLQNYQRLRPHQLNLSALTSNVPQIHAHIQSLQSIQSSIAELSASIPALAAPPQTPPALHQITPLLLQVQQLSQQLETILHKGRDILHIHNSVTTAAATWTAAAAAWQRLLLENPACPTCGSPLAEHPAHK